MTRESKLYPAQIQAQCQSAVTILETDNQNLELTSKAVSAFVNDTLIESVAFDQLKMQCENYIGIISSMKEINSSDIADYNTLSGAVGSEELIGAVILDNMEKYLRLRDEAYVNEENYKNLASQYWWIPSLAAVYMARASYYHIQGEFYDWQYQYWLEKEMEYDNIEAATAGLFANSAATRAALEGMLSALQGAFKMDFGYIPEAVVPAKLQLECVMMGDADTANGIKALDEYLVQSGKFTQEERAAIISSALKGDSELLKEMGKAIALGVAGVSAKVMKEMATKFTENKCPTFDDMYNSLSDFDKKFVDGIENLDYTDDRKTTLRFLAINLLNDGYKQTFVVGMMANIVNEAEVGKFESSNYSNQDKKPAYLHVMDNHFEYRNKFSNNNIQMVGISAVKELNEQCKAFNEKPYDSSLCGEHDINKEIDRSGNRVAKFGLGMAQFTDPIRRGYLIDCYVEQCGENNSPSIEQCAQAEVTLISRELSGYYKDDDYSNVYIDWEKKHENNYMTEEAAKDATMDICIKYEAPYDKENEALKRSNDGEVIYNVLIEGK